MKKIYGNTTGLRATQIQSLEHIYRFRIPPDSLITPELTNEISRISFETRRQIGILVNRSGKIIYVILGDAHQIVIPDTLDYRAIPGKLKGLRCIHTHVKDEELSRDDLTDLALLRLDVMAAISISDTGEPHEIHVAHIRPGDNKKPYNVLPPFRPHSIDFHCGELIRATEAELTRKDALHRAEQGEERALLISASTGPKSDAVDSLSELKELTESSGIHVLDTILQQRRKIDPKFVIGKGKISDLTILALQMGATIIIFDQELNPSQIRSITDHVEMKVIDRTQLILDIFAQRAQSREGKLQVELAQLNYLLPRLVTKNTAMSRLTGGIGGRGPGETKLEINRRRVRDRISQLNKSLKQVKKQRKQQKAKRNKRGVPVISIVGYTNAGKSTLLNTLTQSMVLAEDRLFATLDPSSRRLRLPREAEVIITDTVGFIKDLPKELMVSFRATLEELEGADVLLHVIDSSNPRHNEQIESVEKILTELDLNHIPVIYVMNKMDLLTPEELERIKRNPEAVTISAMDKKSLIPLLKKVEKLIEPFLDENEELY